MYVVHKATLHNLVFTYLLDLIIKVFGFLDSRLLTPPVFFLQNKGSYEL